MFTDPANPLAGPGWVPNRLNSDRTPARLLGLESNFQLNSNQLRATRRSQSSGVRGAWAVFAALVLVACGQEPAPPAGQATAQLDSTAGLDALGDGTGAMSADSAADADPNIPDAPVHDADDPASADTESDVPVGPDAAETDALDASDGAGADAPDSGPPSCSGPCDDGNPCTLDTCDSSGSCAFAPQDGANCEDGKPCTEGDSCQDGQCQPGPLAVNCACLTKADCAPFEDGKLCNGTLYCAITAGGSSCQVAPNSAVVCGPTGDPCKVNSCQEPATPDAKPSCAVVAAPDKTPCTDYSDFTVGDVCISGACQPGTDVAPCGSDADCAKYDDQDLCNGTQFCNLATGKCQANPKTVVVCPTVDNTFCLQSQCQPKTGQCQLTPIHAGLACDDGDTCTQGETCEGGVCTSTAGADVCQCVQDSDCAKAEDGDLCNGKLFCDKAAAACKVNPATVVICPTADNTQCSVNTCDKKSGLCGMVALPDGATCDADGTTCTPNDTCQTGECKAAASVCVCIKDADCANKEDGNPCNGTLYCDMVTHECAVNPATLITCPSVNDTACSVNQCQPASGKCAMTPVAAGSACQDADPCTAGDQCDGKGGCKAGANLCQCKDDADCAALDNTDLCDGTLICDKVNFPYATCATKPGSVLVDAAGCSDENACTNGDLCLAGKCTSGAALDCNDGNVCTADSCSSSKGCVHTAVGAPCSDGDACTTGEGCVAGACIGGKPVTCTSPGICKVAACNPVSGACDVSPSSAGTACSDGQKCTSADSCDGKGSCKGTMKDCTGLGVGCTYGSCDEATVTCVKKFKPEGTFCDDGVACTTVDTCSGGVCQGTASACEEERVDTGHVAASNGAPSIAHVGQGRFVVSWRGAAAGQAAARWISSSLSLENELVGLAPAGAETQNWPGLKHTLAADAKGQVVALAHGVNSQMCSKVMNCTSKLGPIYARKFDINGAQVAEAALQTLQFSITVSTDYASLGSWLSELNYQPMILQDGSLATVFGWKVGTLPDLPQWPTPAPSIGINLLPATASLQAGAAKSINTFNAQVHPDEGDAALLLGSSADRIAYAWIDPGAWDNPLDSVYVRVVDKTGAGKIAPFVVAACGTAVCSGPQVAATTDGGFAVAWSQAGGDGNGLGVRIMAYDATGAAKSAAPLTVNTQTIGDQLVGGIAGLSNGQVVVTWTDNAGPILKTVMARRLAATGKSWAAAAAVVNAQDGGDQFAPAVAGDDAGGYMVVFLDGAGHVWRRRFGLSDNALPGAIERPLAATASNAQVGAKLAVQGQSIAAVWAETPTVAGSASELHMRIMDQSGQDLAPEFLVDDLSQSRTIPAIAANSSTIAVAWQVGGVGSQFRTFDSTGKALIKSVTLAGTPGAMLRPAVAFDAAGHLLAAWQNGPSGQEDIQAAVYDTAGTLLSAVATVNTATTGSQLRPMLAASPSGWVVAWHGQNSDVDGYGIGMRRVGSDGKALGKEVTANTTTGGDQAGVCMASIGSALLACWHSADQAPKGLAWRILCRPFDADTLAPLGPEAAVPLPVAASRTECALTPAGADRYALLFRGWGTDISGATGEQVVLVNLMGQPLGPRQLVNRIMTGEQHGATAAGLPGGAVALGWTTTTSSPASVRWRILQL